ncbi:MAG: nitronate monooxygenase, partial [Chloroflexi bacterium]|nr:nitronate monooxygenase [Chloroflexota bacterium]
SKERHEIWFDPRTLPHRNGDPKLKRPRFLAIITSEVLAKVLTTRATGYVDGFIIEGPRAGGHNAPPRGPLRLNEHGEPIYGERDVTDLEEIQKLGRPFWLAGTYNSPEKIREALSLGAQGVQCGTIFAYSDESGMRDDLKAKLRRGAFRGDLRVLADPKASPSGFPFQVAQLEGTLSDPNVYASRQRMCSLGYLLEPYQTRAGGLGLRCASEPIPTYLQKGGKLEHAEGRKCICNGLLATTGLGLTTKAGEEPPIVTSGQDYSFIHHVLEREDGGYTATDAVHYLLSSVARVMNPGVGLPEKARSS